jgi:DNA modification methylase
VKTTNNLDYRVYFGNASNLDEINDGEISLVVSSPPYYNAPFDYPGLFSSYDDYLELLRSVAYQLKKKVAPGRIVALVTDDMLVKGEKFPIVADTTKIFVDAGFRYRERITWLKPKGYVRISKRSGVLMQHPYPMYYYPDNIQESILIFQNGLYQYEERKQMSKRDLKKSEINLKEYNKGDLYLNTWNITNVLPIKGRLEEGIAAFPDEIVRRLIMLYSYHGETILDPFLGSGTTLKVAMEMGRKGVGYELDLELKEVIKKKIKAVRIKLDQNFDVKFIAKKDAKKLRTDLNKKVRLQKSVT